MTAELHIPRDAYETVAYCFFQRNEVSADLARETAEAALQAAAPLVVAAELRRVAAELQGQATNPGPDEFGSIPVFTVLVNAAQRLRDRADELDGGAS